MNRVAPHGVPEHLLLYDGVCALCNRFNYFVLRRDLDGRFKFGSLQSRAGRVMLARFGVSADNLETLYVIADHRGAEPTLLSRSDAVLFVLAELKRPWLLALVRLVPRRLREIVYRAVARNRYRMLGQQDRCHIPQPEERERFLDHSP